MLVEHSRDGAFEWFRGDSVRVAKPVLDIAGLHVLTLGEQGRKLAHPVERDGDVR